MHKLVRIVRFSVNPFLKRQTTGANSYTSKPSGEGLSLFFELSVGLVGPTDPATGFVVNVTDIDKSVRENVVPYFTERLRKHYQRGEHVGLGILAELLRAARERLAGAFGKAMVAELALKLNPNRTLAIDCEDKKMIYFSEKFEFAATHKLWNEQFTTEQNFEAFGKCANPAGHGHNYLLEVAIKAPQGAGDIRVGEYEEVVEREFIGVVDHKNLNVDVGFFAEAIPSVENIAVFAWERLDGKFGKAKLHCVTVWETDRTYCTYYGQPGEV